MDFGKKILVGSLRDSYQPDFVLEIGYALGSGYYHHEVYVLDLHQPSDLRLVGDPYALGPTTIVNDADGDGLDELMSCHGAFGATIFDSPHPPYRTHGEHDWPLPRTLDEMLADQAWPWDTRFPWSFGGASTRDFGLDGPGVFVNAGIWAADNDWAAYTYEGGLWVIEPDWGEVGYRQVVPPSPDAWRIGAAPVGTHRVPFLRVGTADYSSLGWIQSPTLEEGSPVQQVPWLTDGWPVECGAVFAEGIQCLWGLEEEGLVLLDELPNDGTATIAARFRPDPGVMSGWQNPALADLDGDGHTDVAFLHYTSARYGDPQRQDGDPRPPSLISIFRGPIERRTYHESEADLVFALPTEPLEYGELYTMVAADVDSDGIAELAVGAPYVGPEDHGMVMVFEEPLAPWYDANPWMRP